MSIDQMVKNLLNATQKGDVAEIRNLHAKAADVFQQAARTKDFQMVFVTWIKILPTASIEELVRLGVDLNRHENEGYAPAGTYPLGSCISRGDRSRARFLLELGADPNKCFALDDVAYMDNPQEAVEMAQLLIEYGADVNQELAKIPKYTPLCRAFDNGKRELADFLISKGAVCTLLDESQTAERIELDLETFQARLEKACTECWQQVREQFPAERFCMFGLETDSDFVIQNPLLDSEGAVERDSANRRPGKTYVARVSLDCDSEFYGQGKEPFDLLSAELNSQYGVDEGRWARSRRIKRLTEVFESALKSLDQKGLFGTGAQRDRMILLVSIIDANRSEWNTMLKIAKRLNPSSVFEQFRKSLR